MENVNNGICHDKCVVCGYPKLEEFCIAHDDNYFERNNILFAKKSFTLVKCLKCKMVFVQNPLNSEIYKVPDILDYKRYSHIDIRLRHYYIIDLITYHMHTMNFKEPEILEIGCGFGEVYQVAKLNKYKYYAIEPSKKRVEYVRSKNLDVFEGTFEEYILNNKNKQFDIIILDNVLEHIPKPRELLEKIDSILKYGGRIIIIVPNLNDIRGYIIPFWKKKQIVPVGHCNYFTKKTLITLLDTIGYKRVLPIFYFKHAHWCINNLISLKILFEYITDLHFISLYMSFVKRSK